MKTAERRGRLNGDGSGAGRTVIWTLLGAGSWLLAAIVAYAIATAATDVVRIEGADFEAHRWRLSIFVALWGLLAGASLLGITSVIFGVAPGALRRAIPWLIVGSAIAALLEFALLGWGAARFGDQGADPDLIGYTAYLAAAVAAVAVGAFAQSLAPHASLLPRLLTLAAAAVGAAMVALNVPGLFDGVEAGSIPLVMMVGASGAYVIAAGAFSLAQGRSAR